MLKTTAEHAARLRHIQELTLFEKLPVSSQEALAASSLIERFERGELLWRAGQEAHYFSFILEGHVKLTRPLLDGRELIIEIVDQGATLEQMAALEHTPYVTNAEALDDVRLLRIMRPTFLSQLRQEYALLERLLRGQVERNRALTQRLTELATASAEQRLAMLFWEFAQNHGRRQRSPDGQLHIIVRLPLSRQDLASLINTRVETAIRLMSKWGKGGLVRTEDQGFRIIDVERLKALAYGELLDNEGS